MIQQLTLTELTPTSDDTMSGACPESVPRPIGTLCNNGSNVCDDSGNCVGSYCLQFTGLDECQCTAEDGYEEDRFCDVCCLYQGRCRSTFDLTVSVTNLYMQQTVHLIYCIGKLPTRTVESVKGHKL